MLLPFRKLAEDAVIALIKTRDFQTCCQSYVTKDEVTTLLDFLSAKGPGLLWAHRTSFGFFPLPEFDSASHGLPPLLFLISRHKSESSLVLRPFHFSQRTPQPPSGPSAELAKEVI